MKKHLLTIITTALVIINLVMSIVIVFTVLPTTMKMNNLITQICAALSLDLESESENGLGIKIDDMEEIPIEGELTIPLKVGDDGEEHYAIVEVAVIVNKEHEDYKKYVGSITEKSALVKDAINTELRKCTIDDLKKDSEAVQESVCECLQSLFNSRFIVKVAFKNMVFQ